MTGFGCAPLGLWTVWREAMTYYPVWLTPCSDSQGASSACLAELLRWIKWGAPRDPCVGAAHRVGPMRFNSDVCEQVLLGKTFRTGIISVHFSVLFLGVPVRVFPGEISIWTGELSKADHLPNERASLNLCHPEWNRKTEVWTPSLPDCWAGISIFSCPWNSCFSGLQTQTSIYTISSQAFQLLHWLSWVSSMSISACITTSVNSL